MKWVHLSVLLLVIGLGFGTVVSCADDDDGDSGDDDAADDDADDDAADDDADAFADLIWQDPPAEEKMTWFEAIEYCKNASIDGQDEWRLPSISELRSLIRGCAATELGGSCGITDDCAHALCWNSTCSGCGFLEGPGVGGAYWPEGMSGEIDWYWSYSQIEGDDVRAWGVYFDVGDVGAYYFGAHNNVRCVRG